MIVCYELWSLANLFFGKQIAEDIIMTVKYSTYPQAPDGWDIDVMRSIANGEGLEITDEHMELVHCLQEYYTRNEHPKLRGVCDALEEHFHAQGGMKHLYHILPGGPIAQGCRLSGLDVPPGSVDYSFGSVA